MIFNDLRLGDLDELVVNTVSVNIGGTSGRNRERLEPHIDDCTY